jgi:hypothetical protein
MFCLPSVNAESGRVPSVVKMKSLPWILGSEAKTSSAARLSGNRISVLVL